MAGKVSANGKLGGGKPTPEIYRGNLDRRSKPPDPRKGRSGSSRSKIRITLLRYEDELVSRGGPEIRSIQKEGSAIEIRRQREYSHPRYSPHDPLRSLPPLPLG